MGENVLIELSLEFGIKIVRLYEYLCDNKKEFIMSKQLLRSGTSIGANINEANYAVSKADFINKMQIALKETAETEYWLRLLAKAGYIGNEYGKIRESCLSIKRMLIATLNTSKSSPKATP